MLAACDALPTLFPELKQENIQRLQQAAAITEDPEMRFAVLLFGLSLDEIKTLTDRNRTPGNYKELALLVSKYYGPYLLLDKPADVEQRAKDILQLLMSTDALRREARFQKFRQACDIIYGNKQRFILDEPFVLFVKNAKLISYTNIPNELIAAKIKELRLENIQSFITKAESRP